MKEGQTQEPVGIDVEALAKEYADKWLPNDETDDWWEKKDRKNKSLEIEEHFENGFKAGYSASLPQSSTEEEVEIIDGYTQLMIDRRSLPKDGQRIKFMTENENWYEGYFVGGDDIFHVSDSQFFFKWHVQQWKGI